jgi:branched-chain amino acid transport system permease protein
MLRRSLGLAVLLGLLGFPLVGSGYATDILTITLIYGVFAMSLDLLMGYTGLASFGHAAFLGVGAYASGLAGIHVSASLWVTLALGTAASAIAALAIGALAIRSGGIYFLMLTLAFAQLLFAFVTSGDFAGGANGLTGIPPPVLDPLPTLADFSDRMPFYYLTLTFAVASFLFLQGLVRAPFGRVLVGIRENEARMRALGYATARYKLAAFVIAGALAGAAGSFHSYERGFTSPEILNWTTSGMAIAMVVIGGSGTLFGPIIGAGVYTVLQDVLSSYTDRWQLVLGGIFIVFVFLLRDGIAGGFRRAVARLT